MATGKRKSAKSKKSASSKPAQPTTALASNRKAKGRRRRYSDAERQRILETAKRENLTGAQVRDRFGVSTLSFYTWRKKAGRSSKSRRPVRGRRPGGSTDSAVARDLDDSLREEVRARITEILPEIVRSEIASVLGTNVRGRPRRA